MVSKGLSSTQVEGGGLLDLREALMEGRRRLQVAEARWAKAVSSGLRGFSGSRAGSFEIGEERGATDVAEGRRGGAEV